MSMQRRPFHKGDQVLISDDLVQVMSLQEGHGGWIPEMQSVCSFIIQPSLRAALHVVVLLSVCLFVSLSILLSFCLFVLLLQSFCLSYTSL